MPNSPRPLILAFPDNEWMTSNHRLSRWDRADRIRLIQDRVQVIARKTWGPYPPRLQRAAMIFHIAFNTNGRADADNAQPTCKAIVDALVRYVHLLPDDNSNHLVSTAYKRLTQPPVLPSYQRSIKNPRIVVVQINDLTEEGGGKR